MLKIKAATIAGVFLLTGCHPYHSKNVQDGMYMLTQEITSDVETDFIKSVNAGEVNKVVLASGGGLVIPALHMADMIHKQHLTVIIPKDTQCNSACTALFMAGAKRYMYGHNLCVHNGSINGIPYRNLNKDQRDAVDDAMSEWRRRLPTWGVAPIMIDFMRSTPADSLKCVDAVTFNLFLEQK